MKRRLFIQTAAAGVAAASAVSVNAQSESVDTNPVGLVNLTPQIKTSRVGFGTGVRAGMRNSNMHRMGNGIGVENMRYAYDCGIRFFDMADSYGRRHSRKRTAPGRPAYRTLFEGTQYGLHRLDQYSLSHVAGLGGTIRIPVRTAGKA